MFGSLYIEEGHQYNASGTCQQYGNYAEVRMSLNNGSPYIARIYWGDDGRIYIDGYQPGTPVSFALVRE